MVVRPGRGMTKKVETLLASGISRWSESSKPGVVCSTFSGNLHSSIIKSSSISGKQSAGGCNATAMTRRLRRAEPDAMSTDAQDDG